MSRPKSEDPRDRRIELRLTEPEERRLRKKARELDISVSVLIRTAVDWFPGDEVERLAGKLGGKK